MPELNPLQPPPLWASELIGAQVVTRQGFVGVVAGLVILPSRGVMAFRVDIPGAAVSPRNVNETLLLPFDAVEAFGASQVRVQSADDVVPAFRLPSMLAHLSTAATTGFGQPVRSSMGHRVGYLWDALIETATGQLLEYLIGPTPQQDAGAYGVVTTCQLSHCLIGEFTVQHDDALRLIHLLETQAPQEQPLHSPPLQKGAMNV